MIAKLPKGEKVDSSCLLGGYAYKAAKTTVFAEIDTMLAPYNRAKRSVLCYDLGNQRDIRDIVGYPVNQTAYL